MLRPLELCFPDEPQIGLMVACFTLMGGSDLVPKLQGATHLKVLQTIITRPHLRRGLVVPSLQDELRPHVEITKDLFFEMMKFLMCPLQ